MSGEIKGKKDKKRKLRVGIIFGGKSAEHEVSLQSAKNVIEALDKTKYEPVLIGVDKQGRWLLSDDSKFLLNSSNPKLIKLYARTEQRVVLAPESRGVIVPLDGTTAANKAIDAAFPILHGPFGEDGTMQGLLKLAQIPFVGAGVLGSAVGMDKDVMKRLLKEAGVKTAKFWTVRAGQTPLFKQVKAALGLPVYIKPANLGSSVGVSRVGDEAGYNQAVGEAFKYDRKILIEENIAGREVECAVLGNEEPTASLPGEVIPTHDFYSYEAKYIDEHGAILRIPAKLPKKTVKQVQALAIKAFRVLECEGMARVDCFVKKNGEVIINEINTIPGFTAISMYPKLWEASGIPYRELISRLIELAVERFEKEQRLRTAYGGVGV